MFLKLLPHKCSVAVLKYLPVGLSSDPVPSAENQVNLILINTEPQFCNNTAFCFILKCIGSSELIYVPVPCLGLPAWMTRRESGFSSCWKPT